MSAITDYYDTLGPQYDDNRFGSSYGKYIHSQELLFFHDHFTVPPSGPVIDLGCGTGRFLQFATDGIDFSEGMLDVARAKFPDKTLTAGDITDSGLPAGAFAKAFSMHVVMHLDHRSTQDFLAEAHRLLRPGGLLLFDFPSLKRRAFGQRKATSWHGSNALGIAQVREWMSAGASQWELVAARGVLFFPIHRLPVFMRRPLIWLDTLLCRSFLKEYASYVMVVIRKR